MTEEKKARYVRYQVTIRNQYLNITDIHGRDFELPREIIREAEFIVGYEELEGVVLKDRFTQELSQVSLDTEKTDADRPVTFKHDPSVLPPDYLKQVAVALQLPLAIVEGRAESIEEEARARAKDPIWQREYMGRFLTESDDGE